MIYGVINMHMVSNIDCMYVLVALRDCMQVQQSESGDCIDYR